ncbi:MAG TPA: FAD binding domain-containing protein [Longimicrobiales bacterium]|nr:FAD binding domain-containing protein [Longimicrobiales bacterium]
MLRLHEYRYHRPESLGEALALLAEAGPSAMLIAGGTDLMPNMKHRLFTPAHLVALKGVPELRGIDAGETEVRIGAAETLAAVARHPLLRDRLPSLAKAAGLVAGPQLRNMGTLGGNVCLDTRCTYYNQTLFWRSALGFCLKKDGDTCHVTKTGKKCVAAHSADTPPVLITLGATIDLASSRGTRSVPAADFFVADGIHNTVREPDEIVVAVRVPVPPPSTRTAFEKLRQRGSIDFPLLNVALAVDLAEGDVVTDIRLVVSALGSRPRVVAGLDKVAAGRRLDAEVVDAVARRAFDQCHPLTNIIVDPDWRRAMVPVHVRRALALAARSDAAAPPGAQ